VTIARRALLIFLSFLLIWKIVGEIKGNMIPVDDFAAYWAAARLQLQGQNPYSSDLIWKMERLAGREGHEPLVMLNPPWTLAFLLAFGFLDYPASRLAWLILELTLVVLSLRWLWIVYQGPNRLFPVALVLAFCFVPLLVCLILGQITPLILFGVSGFLYFEWRSKPLSAGVCLVLLTLKPHLFYLFWPALLLWIIHGRRWKVLVGASICGAVTITLATIWNSAVIAQYIELTSTQPPVLYWRTPTLGTLLRTIFGMEHTWLQFAPMIAGMGWVLFYWQKERDRWVWSDQMPLTLMMSLVTTSYVWFYDQMLFLPAILQVAATRLVHRSKIHERAMIAAFFVMNLVLVTFILLKLPPLYFVWSFGCWLVLYCLFLVQARGTLAWHIAGQAPAND
jgi:Glycosyltransferase family 87